ncbi:unnamed protein product [Urochloa humidicola]
MDQHGEKEAGNKSQDSTEQHEDDATAAEEEEDTSAKESSMDQREGNKAEESAGLLIKEVVGSGEESSPPPALFAHPCSLLQLLLRACAGCLGLHGDCASDPKPPDAAAADSSQEEEGQGGGDKANCPYMQEEVITRVWAVRRPPGRPREGSGGNGGVHH